ncbi:MAG: tyrosine recombinase XerC [Clostridia bacterium]|nr:tyrosine recombinase XerC [Clostridia bacterium]
MPLDYHQLPPIARDFLSYMETIRNKSYNTVKEYYYDLRMYFRYILKYVYNQEEVFDKIKTETVTIKQLEDITLSDLYSFMTYLSRERKSSPRTRARKVATLKSFYKYMQTKAKVLKKNPAAELDSPKIIKDLPKYLDLQECRNLLSVIDGKHMERDYAIITLFLNCGLRITELISIDMDRIKNDTLTIVGKGNKERTIYLNNASLYAIKNYMQVRPAENVIDKKALFLSERKLRISRKTVHVMIKNNLLKAGLDTNKYSAHKLRHTAATLMYRYGQVDIRTLQKILGHESISTTEIYTHVDNTQLREATQKNPLANINDGKDK